ncbi:PREDICTED: scm-like with four MBT domains protein 1 isoform X6 [Gavialis gangeticus]|uniref:scm-like with four MBT domains protein 1 isoform X6 n=1 Tax=Gavialis gangeticus TaxID=94835 RepID=UPI00092F39E7|nr:PREDICTED: scm-like with four MBT domains protein 1 isoform X6 [Gavialis gangeticus]
MNEEQHHDADAGSAVEEAEFSWDEYLEETGATAAPHGSFKHVDTSLRNGFAPGMKLEVAVKSDQNTYWVATIVTTCGQLLLLRYDGYGEDRKADFWCDVMTADLHPVGWCEQNKKILKVPEGIKEKIPDQEEFLQLTLKGSCSAPANLLEGLHRGKNPLDLIAPGSRLELQNSQDFLDAWIVNVVENVGGRLKLRYEGLGDSDRFDKWMFYLDPFLHQVGWAAQQGYSLQPPLAHLHWSQAIWVSRSIRLPRAPFKGIAIRSLKSEAEWQEILKKVKEEEEEGSSVPTDLFKEKPLIRAHSFSENMKLEAVNPGTPFVISPATVIKLTSDHGFKENMKLEAVNPVDAEEICIATVTKVKGSYLWLQLEGSKTAVPECIVSVESMNIFPVGWCETNGYQLRPPRRAIVNKQKKIAVVQPEKQILSSKAVHEGLKNQELNSADSVIINGKYCCPKIYFNHRCFSGPYLNKGRIAELPQSVGPGNCVLVLKEVLTLLINAAYKPSRVLRELQLDEEAAWLGHGETLKAKYKGKSYRAIVEVVRTADRVADFCRKTCIKLECCPNLFGPQMVLDKCSENCSVLTKTKYTHYYGKRRNKRIGRPPGVHSNLEADMKKPNKRRKRRKHFVHKKKRSSTSVDNSPAGSPQGSAGEEDDDQDEVDEESLSEDSTSEQQDELLEESEVFEKKSVSSSPTQSELSHSLAQDQDKQKRRLRTFSFSDDENKPPSPNEIKIEVAENLQLDSNPLEWSVADVVRFLKSTDCAPLARIFLDQEIDGQALLLLTLPTVQECMDLKLGPAIKLCHHIERVKFAFYQQFAN